MNNNKIHQWMMVAPSGDMELIENPMPDITEDEAIVKVAGCGVCHTDISFWHHGVKTKNTLPLTLGHEISGTVIKGPDYLMNKPVIIPAVLPCGECDLCLKGRSNICQQQKMPGNDFHGGFASHIVVPHKYLCQVPKAVLDKYSLEQLAVIADAISTPYQVVRKSELMAGDLAIVIGVGGVGIYAALIAGILGARVLALDINTTKLQLAKEQGVEATLNIKDLTVKEIKAKVKSMAVEMGTPAHGWKIFEMSGTKEGQELAFNLITFASTLSVVGFTMDKLELRLSNLMAFDAKIIGTWGCMPELYPEVLSLIEIDKLRISAFVETFPMSQINEVFRNTLTHKYVKRSVLVPDFIDA